MALPETIEKVKVDLRIRHDKLDADIADQIDACLQDLQVTAGVLNSDETDPMILAAIKLYVRANETDDVDKGAAYMQRYNDKKACLQLSGEYGGQFR